MQCCHVSINMTSMDLVSAKLFTHFTHIYHNFGMGRDDFMLSLHSKNEKTLLVKYLLFCDRLFLGTKIMICPKSV